MPEQITTLIRQAIFVPEIAEFALSIVCFGFGCLLLLCGTFVLTKKIRKRQAGIVGEHGTELEGTSPSLASTVLQVRL